MGKVLGGTSLHDLPVALPTKFELVLNLHTAAALDLTIPSALRFLSDELAG